MMYFLDFDRTLFDTDEFNRSLLDEPGCAAFRDDLQKVVERERGSALIGDIERQEAWQKVSGALAEGSLSFAPGYLARFLYQDVPEFLRLMGNEAIVMTYGDRARQRAKVESALAGVVRVTTLYTDDMMKADFLAQWPGYIGGSGVFVDDRVAELEAVATRHPALRAFEMRRDGAPGDGRWPVVRGLSELP